MNQQQNQVSKHPARAARAVPSELQTTSLSASGLRELMRRIEVIGEGKVRVSIEETSRTDLLVSLQEAALDLHKRLAVHPKCREDWAENESFALVNPKGAKIAVDGNVAGSTNMFRAQQTARGWNNVELCDLVIAHAAYFVATGKDLFSGNVVRASNGALRFEREGLVECLDGYGMDYRSETFAASARLAA